MAMSTTVTDPLKVVLADTYTLYLKTQNFHWNVTGEQFFSLHDMFEKQYEDLANAVDEIAERLRALGEKTPASFKEFLGLSTIEEAKGAPSDRDMIKLLEADQTKILNTLKGCLDVAQREGDEVTADMLISRMTVHEKNRWMLQSSL